MSVIEGGGQRNIIIINRGRIGYTRPHDMTNRGPYGPGKRTAAAAEPAAIPWPSAIDHRGEETWGCRRAPCANLELSGREPSELERLGDQTAVSLGKRVGQNSKAKRGTSMDPELPKDLDCLRPDLVKSYQNIGGRKETAQVHPYQLTMAMLHHPGWGHSATIMRSSPVSVYAPFTEITFPPTAPSSLHNREPSNPVSPEICARPNIEIYVFGEVDTETRCDDLIGPVSSISDHIRLGHPTHKQACYLLIRTLGGSARPHIGETGTEGLFVATGNSYWGINDSLTTGKLLSEIVFEGKAMSLDMIEVDPWRIR
ncbi:hypothetical protein HOY80DRAFT_1013176 [Tuber brumale]|nr:hypothetical protein HOY80DRAFT_1013176 [Tuber brumale]